MNIQLNYYKSKKINPVEIALEGTKWDIHFLHRKNLIEQHLKLPSSWFEGKKLLEFGPNKGEHALIFAMLGSTVTLVEPNKLMHKGIKHNFQKYGLSHKLDAIHNTTLEKFETDRKFDIVWAEGFLHALKNRGDLIKKLCSLTKDKVVYTYSDVNGYFFETFKRYLFKKTIEEQKIDNSDWPKIYRVAKLLFLKPFLKLNSSRSFESWVRDVIINPCQVSQSFDKFKNLISYSDELNFNYYSGSPCWDQRNNFKWYKNIDKSNIIEEYNKNISFFITGDNNIQLNHGDIMLINKLTKFFVDYSSGIKVNFNFKNIKLPNKFPFNEIKNTLNNIHNFNDLIIEYEDSKLSNMWGMPNHHVCLSRF